MDCLSDPLNSSSIPLDNDSDSICDPIDEDIDGDELPNAWEILHGFDPYDSMEMES